MKIRRADAICLAVSLTITVLTASSSFADTKKKKQAEPQVTPTAAVAPATPASMTPAQAVPEPVPQTARPTNGSLFSDDARNLDLYGDFKPHHIGDLVFIDVVESSAASVSSSASSSHDSGTLGTGFINSLQLPATVASSAGGVVGALGSRKFDGKGSTDRKTTLKARIAARVVGVMPNGDLKIEAAKSVKINKEEETLTLSGLVRPRDVSPDNAVASTSVADLRVNLNGKGVASANNSPGWLMRFLEKISPF
jgi:flagellar L-ring protein FlgH